MFTPMTLVTEHFVCSVKSKTGAEWESSFDFRAIPPSHITTQLLSGLLVVPHSSSPLTVFLQCNGTEYTIVSKALLKY